MSFQTLREISPLLVDLSEDGVGFLRSVSKTIEFEKGSVIFEEDQPATSFYLIDSGKAGLEVSMPARDPMLIETLGPGELLGVSWLFPPHRWSWTARAMAATSLVVFDAEAVRARCENDVDLALHVYRTVAREAVRRLHSTRVRLLDLYPGAEA